MKYDFLIDHDETLINKIAAVGAYMIAEITQ